MLGRLLGILVALPFLYGGAVLAAVQWGGEVVELQTFNERGTSFSTSLWIVDLHDESYLRALDPDAAWLGRLERTPEVRIVVGDERYDLVAVVVEEFQDRINAGMREKYGLADRVLSPLYDPEAVVAVRLDEP